MHCLSRVLVIGLLDVLEVAVLELDDVLAEATLLDLVEGAQFSLLVSPVVEKLLDSYKPSVIKWVKSLKRGVFSFEDSTKRTLSSLVDDLVAAREAWLLHGLRLLHFSLKVDQAL